MEESKTEHFEKFNDLLVLQIKTDARETSIAGTVFSDGIGRIVLYDKFRLDIVPEGTFLHFRIVDRPGIIGKVAGILGDNHINIAGFGLSRVVDTDGRGAAKRIAGEEVAFVSVDSPIGPGVLADIRAIDGMIEASVVHL